MRNFETGATRDSADGKLDYEGFFSPLVMKRLAQYMHKHQEQADGTIRTSDNWQKGIPTVYLVSSAVRHLTEHASGVKKDDESGLPHLWHALWNVAAAIWMGQNKPELDQPKGFNYVELDSEEKVCYSKEETKPRNASGSCMTCFRHGKCSC